MTDKPISFADFHNTYSTVSDLPPRSAGRVPLDFRMAFEGGIERLFCHIKDGQPNTYRAIKDSLVEMRVLEKIVRGRGIYWLGLQLKGGFILGPIFNENTLEYSERMDLECLPVECSGYYEHTDGLDNPGSDHPRIWAKDLPRMLSSWELIDDYKKRNGLPQKALSKLEKKLGHSNIKIWIENFKKDLILVDYARRDRNLYHVKDNNFDECVLIGDPAKVIDFYCAKVILGTADCFDFRQDFLADELAE